jgi:hypothetical protein
MKFNIAKRDARRLLRKLSIYKHNPLERLGVERA